MLSVLFLNKLRFYESLSNAISIIYYYFRPIQVNKNNQYSIIAKYTVAACDLFDEMPLDDLQSNEICPICQEELNENTVVSLCDHLFHKECLTTWLLIKSVCPICKSNLLKTFMGYIVEESESDEDN